VSSPALDLLTDSFDGTHAWRQEVLRELVDNRPVFVLLDRNLTVRDGDVLRAAPGSSAMFVRALSVLGDLYSVENETPHTILLKIRG